MIDEPPTPSGHSVVANEDWAIAALRSSSLGGRGTVVGSTGAGVDGSVARGSGVDGSVVRGSGVRADAVGCVVAAAVGTTVATAVGAVVGSAVWTSFVPTARSLLAMSAEEHETSSNNAHAIETARLKTTLTVSLAIEQQQGHAAARSQKSSVENR